MPLRSGNRRNVRMCCTAVFLCSAAVLTASTDVDVQVAFDNSAVLERLSSIHGVDDLLSAHFITRAITGFTVRAGVRQTDSESHTWYTMVTDNGFYMKQLDSDFEIPPPPRVPLCKSYPTTHLLGAVRVYPDGHSPIHPLSWMMKTLFCWFMNLKQVSALMQRQPSNL